jgi:hypothetical protein
VKQEKVNLNEESSYVDPHIMTLEGKHYNSLKILVVQMISIKANGKNIQPFKHAFHGEKEIKFFVLI